MLLSAEGGKKGQLNKKMQYYGTPLGICAKNNNVDAFIAIVEKGADLNKVSLADRPLKIAFRYSPDIVFYIYENYREQFMKEIAKEGFPKCQKFMNIVEVKRYVKMFHR